MLQELATQTAAQPWAIGSLIFFCAAFLVVATLVITAKRDACDRAARLPLEDLPPASAASQESEA
jgi:hypothetical protein